MSFLRSLTIFSILVIVLFAPSKTIGRKYEGKTISGRVTNGINNLSNASVRIKATLNFTTTDYRGNFKLRDIEGEDTLTITAWVDGYYNGQSFAVPGDTHVVVALHKLYSKDNPDYAWLSPEPIDSNALNCGNYHPDVLMDPWRYSAHGQSAKNKFFHAMYYGTDQDCESSEGIGYKKVFENTRGNCATCHIPGAAVNNPWGVDPASVDGSSTHGVFCDVCHKIKDIQVRDGQDTTGTLAIDFLRPPEGEQVFFGPYDDIHKPDVYSPLISKSEFCAPCHNGKFRGTPVYQSYNEWKASPYPDMGIQCQTCHMGPDGITTNFAAGKGGVERHPSTIPSHALPGSRDTTFLQNAVPMGLFAERKNDTLKVMITIFNDQTGHHVPTDRPSRNMILLVNVEDEDMRPLELINGEVVPSWGGVGDAALGNYAGLPGKGYAKILEDFDGNSPVPAWQPAYIASDNRIAAMDVDTSYYYFRLPAFDREINVNAKLIFRRFFKDWMTEKAFDIPDILMEEEQLIFRGQ